jgi:hypothetical protein
MPEIANKRLKFLTCVSISITVCFLVQVWNKAKISTSPCNEYLLNMESQDITQKQIQKFCSAHQLLAAKLTLRMNLLGCWCGVGKLFPTAAAGHS